MQGPASGHQGGGGWQVDRPAACRGHHHPQYTQVRLYSIFPPVSLYSIYKFTPYAVIFKVQVGM